MERKKLNIQVSWAENNFSAGFTDEQIGTVLVTAKTFEKLKNDFEESFKWHIEGCMEDGDELPEFIINGQYEIVFDLDVCALLRYAENYTSMIAISRASGINPKQLSHYANGVKKPRPQQVQKIKDGILFISAQLKAIC